jgi:hypothetical protein
LRSRYERMLQKGCGKKLPPGPLLHPSQVLMHAPTDPNGGTLWPARVLCRANVRLAAAPFVDREPFQDGDERAFTFADEGGGGPAMWAAAKFQRAARGYSERIFAVLPQ